MSDCRPPGDSDSESMDKKSSSTGANRLVFNPIYFGHDDIAVCQETF